jgi:hypothetical protein
VFNEEQEQGREKCDLGGDAWIEELYFTWMMCSEGFPSALIGLFLVLFLFFSCPYPLLTPITHSPTFSLQQELYCDFGLGSIGFTETN